MLPKLTGSNMLSAVRDSFMKAAEFFAGIGRFVPAFAAV
jgi:hypothetical protein